MKDIAILEDDEGFRAQLKLELEDVGYRPRGFRTTGELEEALAGSYRPDLLLLDVRLKGESGVAFVRRHRERTLLPPIIILSGEASISETVEAMELGVYDFLEKPVSRERLLCSLKNCLTYHALIQKVGRLEQTGHGRLLGEAGCINAMKRKLEKIAPTQGRVLILGESGTGKELVADWIHRHSPRAARPFVKINTAALPPNLIEDELFGHVRGAFTGAHDEKLGLFEQAHGGTLFLDEIGDMEAGLQVRLLRVLEEGVVRRVGGSRDIAVDVRIICATHRDLQEACRRHLFREDLYFRLSTFPIRVPPLRKRGGDIALLAAHFIATFCDRESLPRKKVDAAVWEVLRRYPWPGNVRELRNVCERLAVLGGNPIRLADLPSDLSGDVREVGHLTETGLVRLTTTHTGFTLKTFKHQCEKEFLESALRRHNWDYVAAARSLDIQRTYLHRKIAKLGILKP